MIEAKEQAVRIQEKCANQPQLNLASWAELLNAETKRRLWKVLDTAFQKL